MAIIYCRSTSGGGAEDGSTWADAILTLAAALTAAGAGGTVFVSQAHAESTAAAITLVSPGTAASPTLVLCVNDAAEPPTALADTAVVATGNGNYAITFSGFAYYYGITFKSCVGGTSATAHITIGSTTPSAIILDSCTLYPAASGASLIRIATGASTSNDDVVTRLINSTVKFGATTQYISLLYGRFRWDGGSVSAAGAVPATLIIPLYGDSLDAVISGIDLSKVAGYLISVSPADSGEVYIKNCKLNAAVTVIKNAIPGQGGMNLFLDNCDSSDTNYRMEHYKYEGRIIADTTVVKTGGATNGTTQVSHKMVSLAGASMLTPLEGPEIISKWNNTIGAVTLTLDFVHDQVANLKDDEIWLQVEYPGTAALPQSLFATDFHAHKDTSLINWPTAQGDDQTASAAVWPNADANLDTPIYQKLSVTITTEDKGIIRGRVMLAKPSITLYYDPLLVIT